MITMRMTSMIPMAPLTLAAASTGVGALLTPDELRTILQHGAKTQDLKTAQGIVIDLADALREAGLEHLFEQGTDIDWDIDKAIAGKGTKNKSECLKAVNDFCADLLNHKNDFQDLTGSDAAMEVLAWSTTIGGLLRRFRQQAKQPQ